MSIKCENLLELKCFQQIKLVAGSGGLNHTITWVYINQDDSVSKWIHGGEMVFITGMDLSYSEELLTKLVVECIENAAAGVVILCNSKFIEKIPDDVIKTADEYDMPLFEMPWNLKLVDVTKEIADTIIMNQLQERSAMGFFSELLFSYHVSEKAVKNMGIHCGIDTEKSAAIMIIRPFYIDYTNSDFYERNEHDNILALIKKSINDYFYISNYPSISCIYMDEIFVYINCDDYSETVKIRNDIEELMDKFIGKYHNLRIIGGIGQIGRNLEEVRQSYNEARQAMATEKRNKQIFISLFSELGIIRLLVNTNNDKDLKKFCRCTLKPLIESDNTHNTEYVRTLKAYLNCNCNLMKAAETLYIHRNTIVYRIEKIRTLMNIDFNDMVAKSECMNALRIMDYFGFSVADLK